MNHSFATVALIALLGSPEAPLVARPIATSTAAELLEVSAQPSAPEGELRGFIGHALLGGTHNPRAAALFLGLRHRSVYHRDHRRLFDGLWLDVGTELVVSGSLRPALFVEWLPIKILRLRLQYDFWGWFGMQHGLGHGLVFPSADAPFDEASLRARKGEEQPGLGHRLTFAPTLQLKLWRLVVTDTAELAAWYVHGDGGFWLEPIHDNLIRRGAIDGAFKNTFMALFEVYAAPGEARVLVGALHEHYRSFAAGLHRNRLGGVLSATPFARAFGVDRPTLLCLVGVNLRDQNREGELFVMAGIRVEKDFDEAAPPLTP